MTRGSLLWCSVAVALPYIQVFFPSSVAEAFQVVPAASSSSRSYGRSHSGNGRGENWLGSSTGRKTRSSSSRSTSSCRSRSSISGRRSRRSERGSSSDLSMAARGLSAGSPQVPYQTKVAFQGAAGAYSEKSLRELLGWDVVAVGCETFEDVFRSVANREADYAMVPIENSLGGSIHAVYDNLLRYNLFIIGEHEFRVEHCLMALPGVKIDDVKKVMSHTQALAQCEHFLRDRGLQPSPAYDTAGAAKIIKDEGLTDAAAIASELAAQTYGLEILAKNCEDDDVNFTRFLLLSREPVGVYLSPSQSAKTSIVFTLPNSAGALYKALACFSLREIDFSKIESRPTGSTLLQYLRFHAQQNSARASGGSGGKGETGNGFRRFEYCFYLDFLSSELSDGAQNALSHLKEMAPFVRVLGSYPAKSTLIGPIKNTIKALSLASEARKEPAPVVSIALSSLDKGRKPLKIGIIGFGNFGKYIAETFVKYAEVVVMSRSDVRRAAHSVGDGLKSYQMYEAAEFFANDLDVVLLACSIMSLDEVLGGIPADLFRGRLVVDVLSVKEHPRSVMVEKLPADADILCTHPMFGPESGKSGWNSLPFIYDKVRIANNDRCADFLSIWEAERCKMVEMSCEQHDQYAANTQFITHLMGRILGEQGLVATPIDTKGFQSALRLMENTCSDSFDLFYGLYKFNTHSHDQLRKLRESFAYVERQLAAKEAYVTAKAEMKDQQRIDLLSEVRSLLSEAVKQGLLAKSAVTDMEAAAAASKSAKASREAVANAAAAAVAVAGQTASAAIDVGEVSDAPAVKVPAARAAAPATVKKRPPAQLTDSLTDLLSKKPEENMEK